MSRTLHVAIVGATGAVGIEMIKTLEKRKFIDGFEEKNQLSQPWLWQGTAA